MFTPKDLTEALTALVALTALPELTPSHVGWLAVFVVLVWLTRNRNGQPPHTP
jgi:hypothetical protein